MDDLVIRPVRPDEYARAGEATALAYDEFTRPGLREWDEYRARIADIAGRATRTSVLVALLEGRIVGSATVELDEHIESYWPEPVPPDEAHLRMLGVAPAHRRRGIGRRLVEASVALARAHGRTRLTLETTEPMVAAQRMYEAMGFEFTGRRVFEPGLVFLNYRLDLGASAGEPRPAI